ncbi:MAG: hypothetical protein QM723_13045 [Myxococcaceae bacterium]
MLAACGPGKGTEKFTTWGEEYIETGIPADPMGQSGFLDGWTLHYDKFLVHFAAITVADDKGKTAAKLDGSRLVDNTKAGRKDLISFPDLDAVAWNQVSYQIRPATSSAELVSSTSDDRDLMVNGGFSVYVAGSAQKSDGSGGMITKTFHWGFITATQYKDCLQPAESGTPIEGVVVTNGGTDVSELTTHGDHLYYDRLKASPNPAVQTSLRFDEKAAADTNNDGEITLAELDATHIDVTKYDPSGFDAPTLGAFMRDLARTVGHFRGEGECTISEAE